MNVEELLGALKAVAEPTRLHMLQLLLGWKGPRAGPVRPGERGLCLSDLQLLVGLPPALVSHHLRILKLALLVEPERRGRWTVYRPRADRVALVADSLCAVGSHLPGTDTELVRAA
jgi:ArsR family transcriptional regulator, arsenate/arsenite/antimonite-responsive transcriptional repressor